MTCIIYKHGLAALEQKITVGADSAKQEDYEQALKILCIRAEILNDNSTPLEDKALRMQYQVSQLQQSFGHSGSESGAPQQLRSQWRLTVRLQLSSCSAQLSACHRRLFHCL